MNIIIFFVILLVLVTIHELGHFSTAKWFKVRVDEFGFGFPPKAMTLFKKGETEYTLNWLPIGGFVKIFGEEISAESVDGPDASRSFVNKPKWQQAIILFAGIAANILLAWLLFSFSFMSGVPTPVDAVSDKSKLQSHELIITSVLPGSPAEKAGLKSGDQLWVLAIPHLNKEGLNDPVDFIRDPKAQDVSKFVAEHPNQEIEISYAAASNKKPNVVKITPDNVNGKPQIGISMSEIGLLKLGFFESFVEGAKYTWSMTVGTVVGLYGIVHNAIVGVGKVGDSITGPVGMVKIVGDASKFGFGYLLSFAALISINLAVINLVPFPALDGGRLLFVLIEKIKGSRINPNIANVANMIGFWLLILLMLFVTYNDIAKLI